ncbi:DUF1203 domain-containing protein [Aureimonas sp. AU20]|uniref:DUF1203 domain-containing protein n=1 Tax=Aureimonas sp. AU20 TaxID=1349819 RepID=UPI0007206E14|nr:DUF1203 domain-containing protein [Aureimonas sp. AU20]ALN74873.1 hypothetical protein M673_19290 [Aureimonas sp. AU20]
MSFRITGLSPEPFRPLFGLSETELRTQNVLRMVVDDHPGYPDRITLREVPKGETVLLVNHVSMPEATPYRASHAIFIWEGASERYDAIGEVPEVMRRRLLSLRGFDEGGLLLDADVVDGAGIETVISRLFANPSIATIHVHNAKQGCFSGRIDRA